MSILTSMRSLIRRKSKPLPFPFTGVGSLLLADIAGFSPSTPEVSGPEVLDVMNRLLQVECRCIQKSKGFMPYAGVSEVMLGVWFCPSHATVALETGRRILVESKRVQIESGFRFSFQVRVGVTTGKMTVGTIAGRAQVCGAPFTTAKRLLALSTPSRSQLFCTSETLDLVSDRLPTESTATIHGCSGQEVRVFEFT